MRTARVLLFPHQMDARLEKLEAVLKAAQDFLLDIEENIPGTAQEICPELVHACREVEDEI